MTPNERQSSYPDDYSIDLSQESELEYWTHFFDCTEEQLHGAIALTGPMVGQVWQYLAALKSTRLD